VALASVLAIGGMVGFGASTANAQFFGGYPGAYGGYGPTGFVGGYVTGYGVPVAPYPVTVVVPGGYGYRGYGGAYGPVYRRGYAGYGYPYHYRHHHHRRGY